MRIILFELIKRGGERIALNFDNSNNSFSLNISFTSVADNVFEHLVADEWKDITDCIYYAFWELKVLLESLNAKVTCSYGGEKYKISIIFSEQKKGEKKNEKI